MMEILGEKEYLKSVKRQARFSFKQDYVLFIQGLGPLVLLSEKGPFNPISAFFSLR